jgi:hypothetical protein
MTAADARPRLLAALERTGRLTVDQAALLLDAHPAHVSRWLDALSRDGLAVHYRSAWWAPRVPRTLAAHRHLVADAYVRLIRDARCQSWDMPAPDAPVRPDAWIQWAADDERPRGRVALEADTGTEHRRQWQEKLARYPALEADRLVVLTPTSKSHARLRAWLAAAPIPAACATPDTLSAVLAALVTAAPPTDPSSPVSAPAAARPVVYRWDDTPRDTPPGETACPPGPWRTGARERVAGHDIQHFVRRR